MGQGHGGRPETSLERGMREIKETALNLDKNLKFFRLSKDSEDRTYQTQGADTQSSRRETKNTQAARDSDPLAGFGSSFRPIPARPNTRKVDAFDH